HRQAGARRQRAGVAERAGLARLARIHQGDAVAVTLQPGSRAGSDDSATDHRDMHAWAIRFPGWPLLCRRDARASSARRMIAMTDRYCADLESPSIGID